MTLGGPAPMEVLDLGLVLQRSMAWTCSLGSCSLVPTPAPVKVLALGLVWQRLQGQALSCSEHWLKPVPVDVPETGLLPQKPLGWAWRGLWIGPAHLLVTPLYRLLFH